MPCSPDNKIKSDDELKQTLSAFFAATEKNKVNSISEVKSLFDEALGRKGRGLRMLNGQVFEQNKETHDALHKVTRRCLKILGKQIGNEKDIIECAWQAAANPVAMNENERITGFVDRLCGKCFSSCTYVLPNYIIQFADGVQSLSIGSVRACSGSEIVNEFNAKNENPKWGLVVSDEVDVDDLQEGKLAIPINSMCWAVDVVASPGNVAEIGIWSIDVAISLLRLSLPSRSQPLFPSVGEAETLPTIQPINKNSGVMLEDNRFTAEGWTVPNFYLVTPEIISHLKETGFDLHAEQIFYHSRGSIAERVAQGLGWLSRGRQSKDQSERFLFFFTALEALLSNNDRSSPVTQTIARNVAVLLCENSGDRYKLANQVMDLYDARSGLVHRGERDISISDANTIQQIAESTYFFVLNSVDMSLKFGHFQQCLKRSGYGSTFTLSQD